MNVEIGAETAQFPEKEYKNGIAFAVRYNDGISPLSLCVNAANAPSTWESGNDDLMGPASYVI
jgi:hypothetical protein